MKFNEKQLHLLHATDEVIRIKGYEKTTLRDVAKNSGLNIALISYYFGSKELLMNALIEYRCSLLRRHFAQLSTTLSGGLPQMQLRELIRHCVRHIFRILILRKKVETEFRKEVSMRHFLNPFLDLITQKIEDLLKKGITSGCFSFTQKAEDITAMLVGTIFFAFEQEDFYRTFIPCRNSDEYYEEAEKRISISVAFSIFSALGLVEE